MVRRRLLTSVLALILATAGAVTGQEIGVVAALEPDLRGAPPGQGARALALGTGIVANETITSSASGRGQILFTDRTTLTISPNSEVVLDRFVFDPDGGTVSTGLQLTRGALRFIGGRSARQEEAEIRTPTLIIGIRGSSALVTHQGGRTRAILIAGDQLCAGSGGGGERTCTNRQGGILTEQGYAGQVTQEELARVLSQVDGVPRRGVPFGAGGAAGGETGTRRAGATGILEEADPRGGPLSSSGAQRGFEVFDEAQRSEAVEGILATRTAPALDAPADLGGTPEPEMPEPEMPEPERPEPEAPEPEMPEPEMPEPERPAPERPEPEMPEPEMPEPERPEPELPEPELPEPEVPEPEVPEPEVPEPEVPEPETPDPPIIDIEPL